MGETGMKRYSEYRFGDMLATWWLDRENHMGMTLIPADMIRAHGMIPGLWFEPETCARGAEIFRKEEMLLTRHGTVIDTDNSRFLDLRKPEVRAWLDERVTGLLKRCGFGYTKIDYNDCIGTGCDDPDSLGEGLRQNMQETLTVVHTFGGHYPETVRLPVTGRRILRAMSSENNRITLENGVLTVELKAEFEAIAVHVGS